MDHSAHSCPEHANAQTPKAPEGNEASRSINIRIPKLRGADISSLVLGLLIVLAGIQTVELLAFQRASGSLKAAAPAVSQATPASAATAGALQKQVGGC